MELSRQLRIGVMGPSRCSDETRELARKVGRLVASGGGVLICGGGGGVMEAAASGAKESGGITIGILKGESPAQANRFIDIPIVTGIGNARNVINVLTSEAIIAISGGFGTLSEIALAGKCGTPVIALKTWKLTPSDQEFELDIVQAQTPEDAVAAAFAAARKRRS